MGRPETISCERCGTTVAVNAKGPVPAYCADCRRNRARAVRPERVDCERCGAEVLVGTRGPLPRYCRDGCRDGNGRASTTPVRVTRPTAEPVPITAGASSATATISPAGAVSPAQSAAPVATALVEDTRPALVAPTTVTRMSTVDPHSVLDRADLGRTHRRRQIRHRAAIAAWLILVLAVVLILLVGSRPAAVDFQSYARLLA